MNSKDCSGNIFCGKRRKIPENIFYLEAVLQMFLKILDSEGLFWNIFYKLMKNHQNCFGLLKLYSKCLHDKQEIPKKKFFIIVGKFFKIVPIRKIAFHILFVINVEKTLEYSFYAGLSWNVFSHKCWQGYYILNTYQSEAVVTWFGHTTT